MDISRNAVTGEIVKGSLGNFFRKGDWVDCIDRTTGNIKPEEQPLIDAYDLQEAKTTKLAEIKAKRDEMDLKPFKRFSNEISPAYEVTFDEFLDVTKTDNIVSFVFDVRPLDVPIRTPSEILSEVKESSADNPDYFLPYSCDIIDNAGNFLRKGAVALDLSLRNDIRNHLKNRATQNTFRANFLKQQVLAATTIEEVQTISWTTNDNDTRFA